MLTGNKYNWDKGKTYEAHPPLSKICFVWNTFIEKGKKKLCNEVHLKFTHVNLIIILW